MKIALTGAGGLIGTALSESFGSRGYTVTALKRDIRGITASELALRLRGTDVIINLAGAPIISRWTEKTKKELVASRIETTRKLAEAIRLMDRPPMAFLSGSAIGIYRQTGVHTEESDELADDFLGNLCREWEREALNIGPVTRVVLLRTGIVLSARGGMLKKVLPPFRLGLGGPIAGGSQGFSWIHIRDYVDAVHFLIDNPGLEGVFNMTASGSYTNRTFTETLSSVLKRPAILPIPAFALRLVFGEGAAAITSGQSAIPARLQNAGFRFSFPSLRAALEDLINKK